MFLSLKKCNLGVQVGTIASVPVLLLYSEHLHLPQGEQSPARVTVPVRTRLFPHPGFYLHGSDLPAPCEAWPPGICCQSLSLLLADGCSCGHFVPQRVQEDYV